MATLAPARKGLPTGPPKIEPVCVPSSESTVASRRSAHAQPRYPAGNPSAFWRSALTILTFVALWTGNAAAQSSESATHAMGLWTRLVSALGEKSAQTLSAFHGFPDKAAQLLAQLSGGRGTLGLLELVGLAALAFGGAHVIERLASRRWRRQSAALLGLGLHGLGQRLSGLAVSALIDLFEAALFAGIAAVALGVLFPTPGLQHDLALAVGFTILATRVTAIPLRRALSPESANLRLLPVSQAASKWLFSQGVVAIALIATAYFGSGFLSVAGFQPIFVNGWFLTFGLAVSLLGVWALGLWNRRSQGEGPHDLSAALNDSPGSEQIRALIARNRRWLLIGLILGAWALWAVNLLLDHRESALAVLTSVLLILLYPALDRSCRTIIGWAAIPDDGGRPTTERGKIWPLRFRLLLSLLRLTLLVVVAILALEAWGLRVFELLATPAGQKAVHAVVTLAVAAPLATLIWHGSQAVLERKFGRLPTPGDETPGTRAHTLVPLLRTFLLAFLFVLVTMMVLVSIGVEIGPLIAGAGIFGVAIGFGSQSLVRDVISGFFFLLDDAFRLGEYIDVGKCKGTVERISIRSIQLRHHRGALNTIPYGQIQSISNYTRDWVIEKLEFGLVFGTDPEKVRKLVKKIGQELFANPELAPDILEPLKSQGVQRYAESAMIFRAKVKCRPGRQFTVRREAYRRMQDVFAVNGIEFAHPMLTIRGKVEEAH